MKVIRWVNREQPPLSPPITAREKRWWLDAKEPFRTRVLLQFGLPWFLVIMLGTVLRHPERLLSAKALVSRPIALLLAGGMSWFQWRIMEKKQLVQEVRWKRIRESLAEAESEQNELSSPQRDALE
jgi:hypothetical protein